ncbi:MAG: MBL fold metallo-hydrolase [DPANN group archaeon]|nr:MBL fold metallo-hydrolase [DPANN group archaeon]
MKITFLGAARDIGRSGFLVQDQNARIVLDYGIALKADKPLYPLPVKGFIDAAVLSHSHLDHCGALPVLYKNSEVPCYMTPPTMALASLLIKDAMKVNDSKGLPLPYSDTHFKRMMRNVQPINCGKPHPIANGVTLEFNDAGHIPGAAMCLLKTKSHNLLYTGDFKLQDTNMHSAAYSDYKGVDVLMTETTYGTREHPDREEQEKKYVNLVKETLEQNGNVLLPAFGVGRSTEIIMILRKHGVEAPIYMDGMAKEAAEIAMDFPDYVRDYDAFYRDMMSVDFIQDFSERKRIFNRPGVVVAPAGMLQGGHMKNYVLRLNKINKPKALLFSGYQAEGTPGRNLQDYGKLIIDKVQIDVSKFTIGYFDFSAHAGLSDLQRFVKKVKPKLVISIHGEPESTKSFSEWVEGNTKAVARYPKLGETLDIDEII